MNQLDYTIIALDQMDEEHINHFLDQTNGQIKIVKLGLEVFLKYGPALIERIAKKYQVKIFLDLKLHDIPTTVKMAIRSLAGRHIDFLTVHLGGGEEMLRYAKEEARISLPHTKILGVSFLTCLSDEDLENIYGIDNPKKAFHRLFKLAELAEIDGVICSPYEIEIVKEVQPNLLAITPGIRFSDESVADQKRVASPHEAFHLGADYIVMGRSLTQSHNLEERLSQLNIPI